MSMPFNDTSDLTGLVQHCEFLVFGGDYGRIASNTSLLKEFTRLLNVAVDWSTQYIVNSDYHWKFKEKTDSQNLVDGQQNYTLPSGYLKITAVEIIDANGNYQPLAPIDTSDILNSGNSITDFKKTDGLPMYYDLLGGEVWLYPAPATADVTLTNGLKIFYQSKPTAFTNTDTTATPELPDIFHPIIATHASFTYASAKNMSETANRLKAILDEEIENLSDFMNERGSQYRAKMKVERGNFR